MCQIASPLSIKHRTFAATVPKTPMPSLTITNDAPLPRRHQRTKDDEAHFLGRKRRRRNREMKEERNEVCG
jgi:hypothetical protein